MVIMMAVGVQPSVSSIHAQRQSSPPAVVLVVNANLKGDLAAVVRRTPTGGARNVIALDEASLTPELVGLALMALNADIKNGQRS